MELLNLASNNSFWRGIEYHHENKIIKWKEIGNMCYQGKVRGSGSVKYDVMIDIEHPRKSKCNCPFAEGRRVICKHMIALNLKVFPEKEQQMMEHIEEQNKQYEIEYEEYMQEREDEIREYVYGLSKEELREELIQLMIDDVYY